MRKLLFALSTLATLGTAYQYPPHMSLQNTNGVTQDAQITCFLFQDLSFYDVRSLEKQDGDYSITDPVSKNTYYFNLCRATVGSCDAASAGSFGYVKKESSCKTLTTTELTPIKLHNVESADNFVEIKYPQLGEKTCVSGAEGDKAYKFSVKLLCDSEGESNAPVSDITLDTTDVCAPVVTVKHNKACPVFSASAFASFLYEKPIFLGLLAITFGLIVTFFGRKFFPLTIFATGTIVGFAVTIFLFTLLSILSLKKQESSTLADVLSYLVSGIIGVFLGFILQRMLKIGAAIMGAIGGFFIGIMVYNLLFFWVKNEYFLQAVSVLGAITMTVLSIRQYDNIVIFGTSMVGAYSVVRGFSLFIPGTFPREDTILQKIANLEIETEFYIYVAIFVLLFAGGIIYQNKQRMIEIRNNFIKL